eukprot:3011199-Alexandrium_andersonii.AAC.1
MLLPGPGTCQSAPAGTRAAGGARTGCGERVWRPPGESTLRVPGVTEALAAALPAPPTAPREGG